MPKAMALRGVVRSLAVLAGLLSTMAFAQTDISDTPMAVKNNVAPNFMFMVDNSGSMTNVVPEAPYVATTTYACGGTLAGTGQVDIRIDAAGMPYFVQGSTEFDWAGTIANGATARVGRCFNPTVTYMARLVGDAGAAGAVKSSSGYLPAEYTGNYLNWYFGTNASNQYGTVASGFGAEARIKPGQKTRMEIARTATLSALDSFPLPATTGGEAKVRAGLSAYNGEDGGRLLSAVTDLTSSSLGTLKTAVAGLSASGQTPLSETLADIGQYFSIPHAGNLVIKPGTTGSQSIPVNEFFKQGSIAPHRLANSSNAAAPIQYWCQRSYAILMTDGRPSGDQALSGNSYLCDYDGDSGGCTTTGNTRFDQKTNTTHAGHLGGGHTYESTGSDYLDDVAQALFEVDLRPDLAAPTGRSKKNNVRTYVVGFADQQVQNDPLMRETAAQGGGLFLTAESTDALTKAFGAAVADALSKDGASAAVAVANTDITVENASYASGYSSGSWVGDLKAFSLNTSTGVPITPEIWSAQAKLEARSAASRRIVTFNGSAGAPFAAGVNGLSADLVNYIRGDRTLGGTTFRKREKLLADIINAEPVVVKYADGTAVFQGANDGLLHVFDGSAVSTGGEELWAYSPRHLAGGLAEYASPNYSHRYFVDATPTVADVTWDSAARKILVGGYGKGGRGFYALDITTRTATDETGYAQKVMWEKLGSDNDVGLGFGKPLVVKVATTSNPLGEDVVLVTSGHNNPSGRGVLIGLEPRSGTELFRIDTGVGTPTTPAGLAHIAAPTQLGPNDLVQFVYGGDLLGNVWRFDLAAATRGVRKIAELRDGSGAVQPVSTAPVVGPVTGSLVKNFVYVGTGLYLGDSDIPGNSPQNAHAVQRQTMYGIIDDTSQVSPSLPNIRGSNGATCPSGGGNGDFICQDSGILTNSTYTNTAYQLPSGVRGWYFDIPIANGRVVTHPQLTPGGTLAFTINVPTNVKCDPGGSSWLATINASTGGAIAQTYGGTTYWPSISFLAYALASRPEIVTTIQGRRGVIRLADQSVMSPPIPEPPSPTTTWRRVYWRDLGTIQ